MKRIFLAILFCIFLPPMALQAAPAGPGKAAIASAHYLATEAGHEVLAKGGNAFDAAIAVSAALAVVEPTSSGIGGGGFWLLHRASDGFEVMIDGREKAPGAATADMFLDSKGDVDRNKAYNGPLAAGIPGEPAALAYLAEHYGRLPLSESLAPAIRIAEQGFEIGASYSRSIQRRAEVMRRYPATAAVFLVNGQAPKAGARLVQKDLGFVLRQIAAHGYDGFYRGEVGKRLLQGVQRDGGIWSADDLVGYRVVERKPIRFTYRGATVVSAPPPSAGGTVLAEMLHILEGFDLARLSEDGRDHVIIEAMRRAYRDRNDYLGDPDFVQMPIARLTSEDYAAGLRASIRMDRATHSDTLPGHAPRDSGPHTTHFSLIDADGNMVAATLTVNLSFGSAYVAPGTGLLLNNELDDFAAKPGSPNAYGLVQYAANAIAPGKRPLSSMTPTFVFDGDRTAVLGTPGGSRITTMVLLGVLDFMAGHGPKSWVSLPRFHHQFLPDVVSFEPGAFPAEVQAKLKARGHQLRGRGYTWGNMNAAMWEHKSNVLSAASDPRNEVGKAMVK